jgi:hypothetical protein
LTKPSFSKKSAPSSKTVCANPCLSAKADDDKIADAAQKRIQSLTGKAVPAKDKQPGDDKPVKFEKGDSFCKYMAKANAPLLRRFNRYREALPYAESANAMNQLGDKPSSEKATSTGCLTRLPDKGAALSKALGLKPGTITDADLKNDATGFRAAVFRDETSGKLILVARDTQPTSLVDWQTNTRNGDGVDTRQYGAMRKLAGRLSENSVPFDVAGYSKGGGMAQEAALINPQAKAFVFNSAGLHANSLARTGTTDFTSLVSRTKAFSADKDFLTFMNETTDPQKQLANAQFLRKELVGDNRWMIAPMKIDHRNPAQPDGDADPRFQTDLDSYMAELDAKAARMQADIAAGRTFSAFPPVRAAAKETVAGSMGNVSWGLGATRDGPNLGKLAQHKMENVLDPMKKSIDADRLALKRYMRRCGSAQS